MLVQSRQCVLVLSWIGRNLQQSPNARKSAADLQQTCPLRSSCLLNPYLIGYLLLLLTGCHAPCAETVAGAAGVARLPREVRRTRTAGSDSRLDCNGRKRSSSGRIRRRVVTVTD